MSILYTYLTFNIVLYVVPLAIRVLDLFIIYISYDKENKYVIRLNY